MSRTATSLVLALVLLAGAAVPALAAPPAPAAGGFNAVLPHYEAVRKELLADSLKGVATHAEEIRKRAPQDALGKEIAAAAGQLAAAKDLQTARDAFHALSEPMVRWHETAGGKETVVAYCPMAKRSWLQPKGEIGNPYYGPSMATRGTVVSK
jgi:hypothetical protein